MDPSREERISFGRFSIFSAGVTPQKALVIDQGFLLCLAAKSWGAFEGLYIPAALFYVSAALLTLA
jgi:hypothetical protein